MKNYLSRRNEDNFGLNLFDAFDDFFKPVFYGARESMRTDIKETENGYVFDIDMPGFDKKDIKLNLENGYVTVEAQKEDTEEKDSFIRRERSFSCSRSFYVGDNISEEDIKAKYNNGTLCIEIPKKNQKQISSRNINID